MEAEYHQKNFDEQVLSCNNCHWKGKGSETILIDFYGITKTNEIHCPRCDEKLGILIKEDEPPGESPTDLSFQIG
jgi:hypothetical protein